VNTSTSNTGTATTEASSDTVPPTAPSSLHLVRENGCAEVYLGWIEATDEQISRRTSSTRYMSTTY
jgi:hypothetical protein